MRKKVVILGGGVGGLTAAQELIERGYKVEVYEANVRWGGKARSMSKPHSSTPGRRCLPGEHGFRFFPGFYKHLPDTLKRIPYPGSEQGCYGNLVGTTRIGMRQTAKKIPPVVLAARFPRSLREWFWTFRFALGLRTGVRFWEALYFDLKMFRLAAACPERMKDQYEKRKWWDYLDAGNEKRSDAYRTLYAEGLTRSLVAMKAEVASTRTVGTMFLQMLYYMFTPGVAIDRLLNGPTSDVWIRPWVQYLQGHGAHMQLRSKVRRFFMDGDRISGVEVGVHDPETGEVTSRTVEGDYYVAAIPVEKMNQVTSDEMRKTSKSLREIENLETEWMNGIQFYLDRPAPTIHGHTIYVNSNWALTSISQDQFWQGIDLAQYGDGQVRGILSIDLSDWYENGEYTTDKPAHECNAEEIARETWAQLRAHFTGADREAFDAIKVIDWNLDPDIFIPKGAGRGTQDDEMTRSRVEDKNAEPLLINKVNSLQYRPEADLDGEIPNLLLASDYVRTYTDLATMEGANEAARRAVNSILDRDGSTETRAEIWPLWAPLPLRVAQWFDRWLWRLQNAS